MIRLVGSEKENDIRNNKFSMTFMIYIISIVVSLILIGISFIPGGYKIAETILVSIGCSGIAAAFMAIFIDFAQQEEKKRRK